MASSSKLDPFQALQNIFKSLDPSNEGVVSSIDFARVLNLAGVQNKREAREHLAVIGKYKTKKSHPNLDSDIDYERFMVDGQCVQLRGFTDSIVPPVEPWAQEKKKKSHFPPPLAIATSSNEETHWEAHVQAFQQRRIVAASSLFGRVQRARRQHLLRDAVQRRLERDALRASTLVALEVVVSSASKQCHVQHKAKMWLLERLFHARRHALRRSEALHRLGELGAWTVAAALAGARESTNQTRVWPLWYMARQSTKWLHAVGKHQALHSAKKRAALNQLVSIGQNALSIRPLMTRHQKQLAHLGLKAAAQRRKREGVLIRCFKKADRAQQSFMAMKEAADDLSFIGAKSIESLEPRAGAVAHLQSVGRSVAVVVFKDQLTGWWLNDTGAQAVRHLISQRRARIYLTRRKKEAALAQLAQSEAARLLTGIGNHAVQHWGVSCHSAHLFLRERVSLVLPHRAAMKRARSELMEGLNHAAVTKSISELMLNKPQRLAEVAADVKRSDMKKERERRGLTATERLRLEMEEAFEHFDLDGSGEIGRFEFLAMMKGGRIFNHIDTNELEDIFEVMDKDGSGAIDFEEFWSWLLFELDKIPGRGKSLTVSNILPIRDRAARALLKEEKEHN